MNHSERPLLKPLPEPLLLAAQVPSSQTHSETDIEPSEAQNKLDKFLLTEVPTEKAVNTQMFIDSMILLASHKLGTRDSLRGMSDILHSRVVSLDPETDTRTKEKEPVGISPIPAVVWKLLRMPEAIDVKFTEPEIREIEEQVKKLQEQAANIFYVYPNGNAIKSMGMIEEIKRFEAAYFEIFVKFKKLLDNKVVVATDVVCFKDGKECHRPWRDNEKKPDMTTLTNGRDTVERQSAARIFWEHRKPRKVEWAFAFGAMVNSRIRVSEEIIIEADFPALSRSMHQKLNIKGKYLNLEASPGLQLVELAKELGLQLRIRTRGMDEGFNISMEEAKRIIVDKVPLNLQMFKDIVGDASPIFSELTPEKVHAEHVKDDLSGRQIELIRFEQARLKEYLLAA